MPESLMVALTRLASNCTIHQLHQRYILKKDDTCGLCPPPQANSATQICSSIGQNRFYIHCHGSFFKNIIFYLSGGFNLNVLHLVYRH